MKKLIKKVTEGEKEYYDKTWEKYNWYEKIIYAPKYPLIFRKKQVDNVMKFSRGWKIRRIKIVSSFFNNIIAAIIVGIIVGFIIKWM